MFQINQNDPVSFWKLYQHLHLSLPFTWTRFTLSVATIVNQKEVTFSTTQLQEWEWHYWFIVARGRTENKIDICQHLNKTMCKVLFDGRMLITLTNSNITGTYLPRKERFSLNILYDFFLRSESVAKSWN